VQAFRPVASGVKANAVSIEITNAFHRSVDEGVTRLERPLGALVATGLVGGLDVSLGVFALLIVERETGNHLLGSLAFGIGFIALTLANSELFTENFMLPITAVVAKYAPWWSVLRLWCGTAVFNLIGGWVALGLVMIAFPDVHRVALELGTRPATLGIGRVAFASAIIAGASITLMTWMERATESVPAKLVSAVSIAFVLAAAPLQHAIVISIECFAALHAGAHFGYLDWAGAFGWAALGNTVGGIGLVTVLRLLQVGRKEIQREQRRPKDARRDEGDIAGVEQETR
jgi:formate-nitrite transporter family protein